MDVEPATYRIRPEARSALASIRKHMPAAYGELRGTIDQLVEDPEKWIPVLASSHWLWTQGRTFVLQPGSPSLFRATFEFPGDGIADLSTVTFSDGSEVTEQALVLRSGGRSKRCN